MRHDIVVVLYEEELQLALLQAESIVKFVDTNSINSIIYCVNDENPRITSDFLDEKVFPILKQTGIQIRKYYRDHFTLKTGPGYCLQQVHKIEAAFKVETDFYVVIDSKNFFVKKFNVNELFIDRNPKICLESYEEDDFRKYIKDMYLSYWSVPKPHEHIYLSAMTTPFVFEVRSVRSMVERIEEKENMPFGHVFKDRFGEHGGYSEFLLYSSYMYMIRQSAIRNNNFSLTSWEDKIITKDEIANMIDTVRTGEAWKLCGIHKRRFGSNMNDMLDEIRKIIEI
jgi:hypothetical protein